VVNARFNAMSALQNVSQETFEGIPAVQGETTSGVIFGYTDDFYALFGCEFLDLGKLPIHRNTFISIKAAAGISIDLNRFHHHRLSCEHGRSVACLVMR
jgi:hypothetical protein